MVIDYKLLSLLAPAAQYCQREFADSFSFWVEEWKYDPYTGEKVAR